MASRSHPAGTRVRVNTSHRSPARVLPTAHWQEVCHGEDGILHSINFHLIKSLLGQHPKPLELLKLHQQEATRTLSFVLKGSHILRALFLRAETFLASVPLMMWECHRNKGQNTIIQKKNELCLSIFFFLFFSWNFYLVNSIVSVICNYCPYTCCVTSAAHTVCVYTIAFSYSTILPAL